MKTPSEIRDELSAKGFAQETPFAAGDYRLQDDTDGGGPYIAAWLRKDTPCPLPLGKPEKGAE